MNRANPDCPECGAELADVHKTKGGFITAHCYECEKCGYSETADDCEDPVNKKEKDSLALKKRKLKYAHEATKNGPRKPKHRIEF